MGRKSSHYAKAETAKTIDSTDDLRILRIRTAVSPAIMALQLLLHLFQIFCGQRTHMIRDRTRSHRLCAGYLQCQRAIFGDSACPPRRNGHAPFADELLSLPVTQDQGREIVDNTKRNCMKEHIHLGRPAIGSDVNAYAPYRHTRSICQFRPKALSNHGLNIPDRGAEPPNRLRRHQHNRRSSSDRLADLRHIMVFHQKFAAL